MRRILISLSAFLLGVSLLAPLAAAHEKPALTRPRPSVDVALLLDTSNSMDGLIDQAKGQLWTIVNEFAAAKRHGLTPTLRVALFEYGNTNLPVGEGYLRQVVLLTDDLDVLSEALFALSTRGGDEYCGQVIEEAVRRLDWTPEPDAYKAIFIAGNEPFTQGPVDYQQACAYAIGHGVIVNTIHCGDYQTGIRGKWRHGAHLAEGQYLNINHDKAVVHIDAPQDAELLRLNAELNATYLWYGAGGEAAARRQAVQDHNARSFGLANSAQRVASKASGVYVNRADLVDAVQGGAVDLAELEDEDLPEAMREMDAAARAAYVAQRAEQRSALRAQILALTAERDAFVASARRRLAGDGGGATLADAVTASVRSQLHDAGFETKGPAAEE